MSGITIELAGVPVAKGRPRFAMRGEGRPVAYTPGKTVHYESELRWAAQLAMKGRPLFTGPLEITVLAYRAIPKGFSKAKRQAAIEQKIWPTTRPDTDNYLKLALDALSCVVYLDDAQVVGQNAWKFYSESPRLYIHVAPLEEWRRDGRTEQRV